MAQEQAINWLNQFNSEEVAFASDRLVKTIDYLMKARTPRKGWGAYPKMESDLYHTALVVQALYYSGDKSVVTTVADAASYVRSLKGKAPGELSLEDACDLLTIAHVEHKPGDNEYVNQLLAALQRAYNRIVESNVVPSIQQLSSSLLVVLDLGRTDLEVVKPWTDRLLNLQHPDGGWPNTNEDTSSVVATAAALRVLTRLSGDRFTEALRRGLIYIQNQLTEVGWKSIGIGGDTYSQAVVLRALAEIPIANYKWSEQGVDILFARMHTDGSWGDGPGNVESTALCLLALAAAGQTRFVPARLARVALMEVQSQLSQITEERDRLRQDFERQVQDRSSNLYQERNALLAENQDLKQRLQSTQDEIQKARDAKEAAEFRRQVLEREVALLRNIASNRSAPDLQIDFGLSRGGILSNVAFSAIIVFRLFLDFLLPLVPSLVITGIAWYFLLRQPTQSWQTGVGIALVIIAGLAALGNLITSLSKSLRKKDEVILPISDLSILRSTYTDMAGSWSADVSEEMAYRLFEITDMSPDVANRFTEDLATKLHMPTEQKVKLLSWVGQVTRLDSQQRRLLFGQLQRSILRL